MKPWEFIGVKKPRAKRKARRPQGRSYAAFKSFLRRHRSQFKGTYSILYSFLMARTNFPSFQAILIKKRSMRGRGIPPKQLADSGWIQLYQNLWRQWVGL